MCLTKIVFMTVTDEHNDDPDASDHAHNFNDDGDDDYDDDER